MNLQTRICKLYEKLSENMKDKQLSIEFPMKNLQTHWNLNFLLILRNDR